MGRYILNGQFKKFLDNFGLNVEEALRKAEIPEDIFNRKNPFLTEEKYYELIDAIGSQSSDPELAIKIGSAENIESFSPPVFAAYCGKNAEVCIDRLMLYKRLMGPFCYSVRKDHSELCVIMKTTNPGIRLPVFLVEIEMAFLLHIIRNATKEHVRPLRAVAQDSIPKIFSEYIGCEVMIGNENSLTFRRRDMLIPFMSRNDGMWEFFEPELKKRLADIQSEDSFSSRIKIILPELLPGGSCTIRDVAKKLGMSSRTLQRRLEAENTTFQKQLNITREFLAKNYLHNSAMTMDEIAYMLGYRELNSFLRAFAKWTGLTANKYRKLHA